MLPIFGVPPSACAIFMIPHYPLIDRQVLSSLRLVHAGFNILIVLWFFYQARLGLTIRRARVARTALPFPVIRRHRKTGPFLLVLAVSGFLFGLLLVLLDTGNVLEYAPHFFAGCLIVLGLAAILIVSKKIKGQDSSYRSFHVLIGTSLLALYCIEVFLGIGVLF